MPKAKMKRKGAPASAIADTSASDAVRRKHIKSSG